MELKEEKWKILNDGMN